MTWLWNLLTGASLNEATANMNNTVTSMNSESFTDNSLIFDFIGNIHYLCGDVIWYEIILIFTIAIAFTLTKLVIAILRIIKDIKQTALF